jgi:nitrogen regulatory protein PII-like uncharacterized protein
MDFVFQWTTKEKGNYAIQKRDARDRKAGQEIEAKNRQTSKTHFFLFIDKNDTDSMYNRIKINTILKTISYEYVYRGTDKKAPAAYLKKTDIEKVIENIEDNKNKTIRIERAMPKQERNEKTRSERAYLKRSVELFDKLWGERNKAAIFLLAIRRKEKEKELKIKERELKQKIKQLEEAAVITRQTINSEIKTIEKEIYNISLKGIRKGHNRKKIADFIQQDDGFIDWIYTIAKINKRREAANKRQEKYRENKKTQNGKSKEP